MSARWRSYCPLRSLIMSPEPLEFQVGTMKLNRPSERCSLPISTRRPLFFSKQGTVPRLSGSEDDEFLPPIAPVLFSGCSPTPARDSSSGVSWDKPKQGCINQVSLVLNTGGLNSFGDNRKQQSRNLQLEYVDLYLIHWPLKLSRSVTKLPLEDKELISPLDIKSVWEGMEECHKLGFAKAIGVSNFSCKKLRDLLSIATIPPAVNQVELNPFWHQKALREFCRKKGIHITAYTPLGATGTKWGTDKIIGSDVLGEIGKAKGKTSAQIAMRWVYEQGVSVVAKSFHKERMRQNIDIFDWSLTEEESNIISQFPQSKVVTYASIVGPHDLALETDAEI